MNYDNNPRKVYGKVEIVYSDSEISSVSNVLTSGDASISHPHEVYGERMSPTVKACTMDGNSTMGGGYQMMDNTCTVGWWGNELSGNDGIFYNYPTIEIFFSPKPIISWLIIGDLKLNQYPTDFFVEYKNGNTVIAYQEVLNNTEVRYRLVKTVLNVTSIKLTVYKLNVGNSCVKLMRFFDTLNETYDESDLQGFEVNEEMCAEDSSFGLNSDAMTVTIYNKDKKFTTGYLKNLLVLDRKVKPYLGVLVNGEVQYTSLGTFYSEEWNVSDDGRWVKCTAVDKLMRLQNITYIGYNLDYGLSLFDITVDILNKAGIPPAKYDISSSLGDFIVYDVFMPKMSVWDALQQVAHTGLCNIYVDRSDKIIIRSINDFAEPSGVALDRSNIFSFVSNISLTEFANKISVDYAQVDIGDDSAVAGESTINLAANEELEIIIDYTTEVVGAILTRDNPNIQVYNFVGGINACKVKFINTTNSPQFTNITITGFPLTVNYKTISVQDDNSIRDFGVFEYKHPTTDFIQDSYKAREIATILLNRMKAGEGTIKAVWRGNPNLELGKSYTCDRGPGEENDLICESNKITFDGALREETRGRKKIIGGN